MSLFSGLAIPDGRKILADPIHANADLMEEFFRRARARRANMVRRLEVLTVDQGRVMFDGEWMTSFECARRYRDLRKQQHLQICEIGLLVLILFGMGGVFGGFLLLLCS